MTEAVHSRTQRSSRQTLSEEYSQSPTTASEFYSLLDEVDSEFIADQFEIGRYTAKHDFENHLKIGVFEGIHPSDSLAELAEKTATHKQLEEMAASTFSRHTNDRDYRAVVRVLFGLLHSPQLYHQRNVQRKRLEWLDRAVVAIDGTNLALTRSVTIPSKLDNNEVIDEIKPSNWGLKFNLAARVDGHAKRLLGVSVTAGETREPTQFDHLQDDVEVFADLDSPIHVFDRGYLDYNRFCALKEREKDFVCLLQSDSRVDILDSLQDIDITDEAGTRHVRDELIELAETGETFRRILFEDVDGEEIAYLTTLSSANYDPIDVMNIYTLRTLIEILFRELKQYTNIENFHSQSVNGVLFELFCTLIGYILIEWFRHCHPLRGGVPEAIRLIRTHWNQSLPVYG
ncbi:IS4 family transposase [Natrinema sp. CBA1119]|uniref:IS4 family transposase n=1 Tax=Natrinema sp. CBA1119 TaxID=1608465 RepID=UPI000BF2FFB7|nr:IS4 family transposase [Natrinema sp. CBA1119]PGF14480.1 IS4 family transposase [Natrinema sp. CBA1119]